MAAFWIKVYKEVKKDELFLMANILSFRFILSVFPFIIFIINLTAYFDIDLSAYAARLAVNIPSSVREIFVSFIEDEVRTKRLSLLSTSLIISVYSASSGFLSAVTGLERAYNAERKRGYIKRRLLSMAFVVGFSFMIMISLVIMVFSDKITALFAKTQTFPMFCYVAANKLTYLSAVFIIFVIISFFYTAAVPVKQKITEVMPGALFVVSVWILSSAVFNIYVNNFSRYSVIYGSIGGIFILAYWVYILSLIFLIGGEINAVLYMKRHKNQEDIYGLK